MAYFQVPWATKNGALQTFGCEASIVVGLFLLIVPALQLKGRYLRVSFLFKICLSFLALIVCFFRRDSLTDSYIATTTCEWQSCVWMYSVELV